MQFSSMYPVIGTSKVAETADFYIQHFGFSETFRSDWYISLVHRGESPRELAILDYSHPTMPEAYRKPVQGLLINFEVQSADAEYTRLIETAGLPLIRELKSEDFGQRHFVTVDPSGVLVDVIENIPPRGDFAAMYTDQS
ncbi:MAG: VOC family protein [Chloroflexota bacterium]|nr:VOC family protein [Chloroflexota bacterium]